MSFSFRNALREIRNNRPFCLFYLLNLSLGLVGFIGVNSFKSSLDQKVESESKELLGADLPSGQGGFYNGRTKSSQESPP